MLADDASRSVAGVAVDRGKLDPKDFIFLSRQKEVMKEKENATRLGLRLSAVS